MIAAAQFIKDLATLPHGNVLPQSEAQVRPLMRLPDPERRAEVWTTAVEQAEGGQPSAPQISKLVFEVLHPEGSTPRDNPAARAKQRAEVIHRLSDLVKQKSWKEVEKLVAQLQSLL